MPIDSEINKGFCLDSDCCALVDVPTADSPGLNHLEILGKSAREFKIDLTNDVAPALGLTVSDLILILGLGYDPDRIRQNNWRRLHGLPLKRRKHHG
jgi:hypothetical protein